MKRVYNWLLIYCLLLTVLISCSNQDQDNTDLEKQFSTAIPVSDINKGLQVVLSHKEESFQSGSKIELIIYNKSPYYLYFDNASHMRLMGSFDNHNWIEIKNAINYQNDMSMSPYGTVLLDTRYTVVRPILEQTTLGGGNTDILLRIVVVAEIMEEDKHTGQKVAAFADLRLKP